MHSELIAVVSPINQSGEKEKGDFLIMADPQGRLIDRFSLCGVFYKKFLPDIVESNFESLHRWVFHERIKSINIYYFKHT